MSPRNTAILHSKSQLAATYTIREVIARYIDTVRMARSPRTAATYGNALKSFAQVLGKQGIDVDKDPIGSLSVDHIAEFADALKSLSPATETLYLAATAGFFEYIAADEILQVNLPRLRLIIRQRARRPGQRLPQFPRDAIDEIIKQAEQLAVIPVDSETDHLINLRDRAFLLTLADTGLRVHEACALRRGDLDWNEGKAIIIGKGNRQAVVRFSSRALKVLHEYITARATLDGASGRPLAALPIFARHDRASGKKIKPITTTTGRNIVARRVKEFLGEQSAGTVTPHSFRHYFVTRVLQSSGNIKLAQELARHRNIAVTQRYAHLSDNELDQGYWNAIESEPTS